MPEEYRVEMTDVGESHPEGVPTIDDRNTIGYVDVTRINADTIETVEITFTLTESEHPAGRSIDDVVRSHYDGDWETLKTQHLKSDGDAHTFTVISIIANSWISN